MSQRKVQASGKFEAAEEEECWSHQSPAAAAAAAPPAAGGAGSRLAYNSLHTRPTTSNNYQQTQTADTHQAACTRGKKTQKKDNDQHTAGNTDLT